VLIFAQFAAQAIVQLENRDITAQAKKGRGDINALSDFGIIR
jgi:large exoprotein involved in heme utilization and adhesion